MSDAQRGGSRLDVNPKARRLEAGMAGVLVGLIAGLDVADGELLALAAAAVLGLALLGLVRLAAPPSERRRLAAIVLFAFFARLAVAGILRDASLALGHDGTITGDDHDYLTTSWALADYFRGGAEASCNPPTWCGGSYLLGTFVYLEGFVFFVFGKQLLLMLTLNSALGAGLVILAWQLTSRIWGATSAFASAIAIAVYPGLMLFSAINIKDPLSAVLTTAVLLVLVALQSQPRWLQVVFLIVLLMPIRSLRQYVFMGLVALIPVAVGVAPAALGHRMRRAAVLVAAVVCAGVVVFSVLATDGLQLTNKPLDVLESIRTGMSRGRTGFVQTPAPMASAGNGLAAVQTAVPTTTVATSGPATVPGAAISPRPSGDSTVLMRTLEYLPRGLGYTLFAPFPWAVGRIVDLLVVPDTLMWYLLLACAIWSLRKVRERWRLYLPPALFVLGMVVLSALFEGNVGTLYRHRAVTIVPVMAILAAPALSALGTWIGGRLGRTSPQS